MMWEQSFMSAQPSPIMQPQKLQVLDRLYNEDAAINNLMAILVREREGERERKKV